MNRATAIEGKTKFLAEATVFTKAWYAAEVDRGHIEGCFTH